MMTKTVTFVIGVGGSPASCLWRELVNRSPGLVGIEASANYFWQRAKLDVEIMATGLVCVRLGLHAPVGSAAAYRLERSAEYAPVVIIPPVLNPDQWPGELGGEAQTARRRDLEVLMSRGRGYDVALYMWRKVLEQCLEVVREWPKRTVRVGFHCDTIGYWGLEEAEDVRAFETAYSEFETELRRIGVDLMVDE